MKMGGHLEVQSEPGRGSEFSFTINAACASKATTNQGLFSDHNIVERRATPIAHSRTLTVLIAEDVTMNRLLVEAMLRRFLPSAEFVVARNGAEAYELVRMNPPDIVLMDIQMPVMDGFEATLNIREYEKVTGKLKPVPIVALTAGNLNEEKKRCEEVGMNGCLTKPLDQDALRNTILAVLRVDSSRQHKLHQAHNSTQESHFRAKDLLDGLHGNNELLAQMIEMSLNQFTEYKEEIRTAMNHSDSSAIKKSLHKFKGAALTMMCDNLASLLAGMEEISSGTIAPLEELFIVMTEELKLVMEAMRSTR